MGPANLARRNHPLNGPTRRSLVARRGAGGISGALLCIFLCVSLMLGGCSAARGTPAARAVPGADPGATLSPTPQPSATPSPTPTVIPSATPPPLREVQSELGTGLYEQALAGDFRGRQVSLMMSGNEYLQNNLHQTAANSFTSLTGIEVSVEMVDLYYQEFAEHILSDYDSGGTADLIVLSDYASYEFLARNGLLLDLRRFLSMETLQERFEATWLNYAALELPEGWMLTGLWRTYNPGRVVFYARDNFEAAGYQPPETWDEMVALSDQIVATGNAPWCMGFEYDFQSEYVTAYWLEEVLLRTQPLEAYMKVASGEMDGESVQVQAALEILAQIWQQDGYVFRDPAAPEVSWWDGIGRGLFTEPPRCWMLADWAYLGSLVFENFGAFGEDFDWFILPSIDPQYDRPQIVYGDLLAATSIRPEVGALLDYLTRVESLQPWLGEGMELSMLRNIPAEMYTSSYQRSFAERRGTVLPFFVPTVWLSDEVEDSLTARLSSFAETALEVAGNNPLPPLERAGNITDLVRDGVISIEATGNGIDALDLDIRNLIDDTIEVEIPAGTYFISGAGGEQNMVVRHSMTFQLDPNEWMSALLDAACAEMHDSIPGNDTGFSVQRQGAPGLSQLMPVLEAAAVDYDVEQAAIWIVTNDASYYDLGTLVSGYGNSQIINQEDAAQAMRLVDEAGLNITQYAIWEDREYIADWASPELADWLRSRAP